MAIGLSLHEHFIRVHEPTEGIQRFLTQSVAGGSGSFNVTSDLLENPSIDVATLQDFLQHCLSKCSHSSADSSSLLRLLQDVCTLAESLPPSLEIDGVSRGKRFASGAEATVYLGDYKSIAVAIKESHMPSDTLRGWSSGEGQEILRNMRREIIAHWQLHHHNILPLIGIYYDQHDEPPLMVTPYMEHRSSSTFLRRFSSSETYTHLIIGAAKGLQYLHSRSPPVVHGDLHDLNILVNIWGDALLCDFGLSRIRHEFTRTLTSIRAGGRTFYVAPEISSAQILRPTESSDIYSFAITIYVLGSIKPEDPNSEVESTKTIRTAVESGQRPPCPVTLGGLDVRNTNYLYNTLSTMWGVEPKLRVPVHELERSIEEVSKLLDVDFQNFIPESLSQPLPDDDLRRISKQLLEEYQWMDPTAGVALIRSFPPAQWLSVVTRFIATMLNPMATTQTESKGRLRDLKHMTDIILLSRQDGTFHPALFYYGIMSCLSTISESNQDFDRDVATLLLATGVSRYRVVHICQHNHAENRVLIECWDKLYCEKGDGFRLSSILPATGWQDIVGRIRNWGL